MNCTMPGWLGSNVFCMLVLLYINHYVKKAKMHMMEEATAYHNLIIYVIISLIADSFSRLYPYKNLQSLYPIIVFATYFKYVTLTLMIPLFYKFFLFNLKGGIKPYMKYILNFLWLIQIIITFIVISSPMTKWGLYFDENHIYHRGSLYSYSSYLMVFMAVLVEILILLNKYSLPKKRFNIFVMFLFFPLLGGIVQAKFYGMALGYMGATFSLLIVYIEIVSRVINKDYLTGLNNRKIFDFYIGEYVLDSQKSPVSVIMIDIDYFKEINDNLGHATGDEALENLGEILQKSVRKDDLVCRMGGDEFAILLANCEEKILSRVVGRIRENVENFNKNSNAPYALKISIGSGVYSSGKVIDFLKKIDETMYENKKMRKQSLKREEIYDIKSPETL